MADFGFGIKKFDFFFDRDLVIDRLSKKEQKVLSLTGLRGRDLIRRNVKPAPRNQDKAHGPLPYYHGHKNVGLRYVLFVASLADRGVIIGPQYFPGTEHSRSRHKFGIVELNSPKPIPQLINEGGTVEKHITYKSGVSVSDIQDYRPYPFVTNAIEPTTERFKQLLASVPL